MRAFTKTLAIAGAVVILQGATAMAADLFRTTFNANSASYGGNRSIRITERGIINRCLAEHNLGRTNLGSYALVYNAEADSLQVVGRNGELVCDVLNFSGGTVTVSGRTSQRLTYVYLPGATEAIGCAVITENAVGNTNADRNARIVGRLSFALPNDTVLGGTNLINTSENNLEVDRFFSLQTFTGTPDDDSRVFHGFFVTSSRLRPTTSPPQPVAPPSDGGNNGDGGNNAALTGLDRTFVRQAIQLNRAEIEIGQVLQNRAQSAQVRQYGQMLVADHTTSLNQLISLAQSKGLEVPENLTTPQAGFTNQLNRANGRNIDLLARQIGVQTHVVALNRHRTEAQRGLDQDLRAFAQAQIPVLQNHLQMALALPTLGTGVGGNLSGFTGFNNNAAFANSFNTTGFNNNNTAAATAFPWRLAANNGTALTTGVNTTGLNTGLGNTTATGIGTTTGVGGTTTVGTGTATTGTGAGVNTTTGVSGSTMLNTGFGDFNTGVNSSLNNGTTVQ